MYVLKKLYIKNENLKYENKKKIIWSSFLSHLCNEQLVNNFNFSMLFFAFM